MVYVSKNSTCGQQHWKPSSGH